MSFNSVGLPSLLITHADYVGRRGSAGAEFSLEAVDPPDPLGTPLLKCKYTVQTLLKRLHITQRIILPCFSKLRYIDLTVLRHIVWLSCVSTLINIISDRFYYRWSNVNESLNVFGFPFSQKRKLTDGNYTKPRLWTHFFDESVQGHCNSEGRISCTKNRATNRKSKLESPTFRPSYN